MLISIFSFLARRILCCLKCDLLLFSLLGLSMSQKIVDFVKEGLWFIKIGRLSVNCIFWVLVIWLPMRFLSHHLVEQASYQMKSKWSASSFQRQHNCFLKMIGWNWWREWFREWPMARQMTADFEVLRQWHMTCWGWAWTYLLYWSVKRRVRNRHKPSNFDCWCHTTHSSWLIWSMIATTPNLESCCHLLRLAYTLTIPNQHGLDLKFYRIYLDFSKEH